MATPTGEYQPAAADAAPAQLTLQLPQLQIGELIGRGGMGTVYRARQVRLDRLVALKVLPPEVSSPSFAARFEREARTLARLSHPHIVGIHDFGEAGGLYYLLMEYVEGGSLRQRMRNGRLTPEQALHFARQVCDALEYAHEEGVTHRDIKPDNLLLDRKGRLKVADFGLAKLLQTDAAEPQLTASHQVMGTLRYMAPEQLERPLEVDHRADLYSLGVVLYEMLTGELPVGRFELPSARGVADKRIDAVVLKALEREPGRRYQHAGEMRTAIDSLVGEPRTSAEPTLPMPSSHQGDRGWMGKLLGWPSFLEIERQGLRVLGGAAVAPPHPLTWAFVLCLVGVGVCFEPLWPWMELELATPLGSRMDFAYGYQSLAGLIPGIALLALGFALLASGPRRPRWWHSALLVVVGMVVVFPPAVMLFFTGSRSRNLTTRDLGFVTYDR